jgi:hypothetical protein
MDISNQNQLPTLPDRDSLVTPAERFLDNASSLVIDSQDMYEFAAGELQSLKGQKSRFEEKRKEFTGPLDALRKKWVAFFQTPIDVLSKAEEIYKNKMLQYASEVERKRSEEAAALRLKVAEERRKLEDEAAAMRAKAEEQKRLAEQAAAAGNSNESHNLANEALAHALEAQTVANIASTILTPPPSVEAPKASGIKIRTIYRAEVIDKMALLRAIVEGKHSISLIDDESLSKSVSKIASMFKDDFDITGCRLVKEQSMAADKR